MDVEERANNAYNSESSPGKESLPLSIDVNIVVVPDEQPENTNQESSKEEKEEMVTQSVVREEEVEKEAEQLKEVDISGQGLTMIPATLFKRLDISILNLSSNNIRSLPADIGKLKCLRSLDVSRNGLRCAHVNDTSSLPPEMELLPLLEELNISECNLMHIPPTVWRLPNLRRLDISRNKVRELPGELGCMSELRYFNAQQTGIVTLPAEIVCCEELETLLLFGNRITSLPDTMRELRKLSVLTLNVSMFCDSVDEYMDALLQKKQIFSEHVPPVLFQIPKLKFLDLGCCKLNTLPNSLNKELYKIYLNSNYFTEIPDSVFKLKYITQLEISHNFITTFPKEIAKLRLLKRLVARENQLSEISSAIGHLTQLTHLDLGANQITQIPDYLKKLTELDTLIFDHNMIVNIPDSLCDVIGLRTLDLSSNQITTLPLRMHNLCNLMTAHEYDGLFKHGLWINKNKITSPPEQIWKCTEPQKIWDFLKKMRIRSVPNLQPLKVVVLGNHHAGKTSLIESLISGKSALDSDETIEEMAETVEDVEESEEIVEVFKNNSTQVYKLYKWMSENFVQCKFLDIGCHPEYEPICPHFLDPAALVIIVFDSSIYTEEGFHFQIGRWLKLIQTYTPNAVVKLVGTHSDMLIPPEMESIPIKIDRNMLDPKVTVDRRNSSIMYDLKLKEEESLKKKQKEDHENAQCSAENKIEQSVLEDLDLFREEVQTQLKSLNKSLLENCSTAGKMFNLRIIPNLSLVTSSENLRGMEDLKKDLEVTSINVDYFPQNQRYIPPHWSTFCTAIKHTKAEESTYLEWDIVEEIARGFGIQGEVLHEALEYFNSCCELFWFWRHPVLKDYVFHRPNHLAVLLSCIYRVDYCEFLDYETNPLFNCQGHMTQEQFEEAKLLFDNYGELSLPLVQCLTFDKGISIKQVTHLLELIHMFLIGVYIPLPRIPERNLYSTPVLILPQFVRKPIPEDYLREKLWPSLNPSDDIFEESCSLEFPFGRPMGVVEAIEVCLHNEIVYREDWCGLVFAKANNTLILLQEIEHDSGEYVLKFSLRHSKPDDRLDLLTWFKQVIVNLSSEVSGLLVHELM